jgi:DNA-binding MarR family transcriptional regulator
MSREELISAVIDELRANQVLTDMLDEQACALLGVNRTDGRALDVIDQRGRLTAGELAGALRMSTGAVTTLVDRLERAGLARRVPDLSDRRRVWIEVTPRLHEHAAKIYGRPADVFPDYGEWSDDELQTVLRFQRFGREWLEEKLAAAEKLAAEKLTRAYPGP